MQDLLQYRDELRADASWGSTEHWEETLAEARLLVLGYWRGGCLLAWGPTFGDSVLQVDGGYSVVSIPASKYKYDKLRGSFDILANLMLASCSPSKILSSASVKPAWFSAYTLNQSMSLVYLSPFDPKFP